MRTGMSRSRLFRFQRLRRLISPPVCSNRVTVRAYEFTLFHFICQNLNATPASQSRNVRQFASSYMVELHDIIREHRPTVGTRLVCLCLYHQPLLSLSPVRTGFPGSCLFFRQVPILEILRVLTWLAPCLFEIE